jgi:murein DD-endopeptidase MepM/ murein hydrolase activator NlpD
MGSHRRKKKYTLSLIPADGRSKPVTLLKGGPGIFVFMALLFAGACISLAELLFFSPPLRTMAPDWTFSGHQRHLVEQQARRVDSLMVEIENMQTFSEKVEGVMFREKAMIQERKVFERGAGSRVLSAGLVPAPSSAGQPVQGEFTGRLVTGSVSQRFKPDRSHYGIDIATAKNEPVGAVADGTVIFADWTSAFGYTMIVEHGEYTTFYKHCSRLYKRGGEQVKLGELIALAGDTGQESSGIHLHFEVWKNGIPVDPEAYLNFSM